MSGAAAPQRDAARRRSRGLRWALVVAIVLLAHSGVVRWVEDSLVGFGPGDKPPAERIEVAFVRSLAPSAAPAPAPAPLPRARRRPASRAAPPPPSASAPLPTMAEAVTEPAPRDSVPTPELPMVEGPADATVSAEAPPIAAPASAPPASAAAPSFEWPPSTRVTYKLSGNYRGEVHGDARVQWVRLGERYQVHLDVAIGPSFAPLMARRMTSDGVLGDAGLVPRTYDEVTKLPFQSPRRLTMSFAPHAITLANGSLRESIAGVQDTASQFVQLTWIFTTRPDLLKVGNAITVPLALPRRVDHWIYDVVAEERLDTPLGPLDTFHLKPRRSELRPRGELSAEIWFAPTLQYLPVRIRIQQDTDTFVDLVMEAAPMQAAAETEREAAPPAPELPSR
ncbi:MAG: DUF3108 domain-containing protein [Aquincola sp.]|nr:DUF3108 domain-containing protein [Aquincola sp.]MDH4288982.1 DUF3108 domain-containing protein [Aquincola sp.]MDH5329659.1 DUF3108 domain-containing protein [Aquincola sp.]